jgi:hypothetical protein
MRHEETCFNAFLSLKQVPLGCYGGVREVIRVLRRASDILLIYLARQISIEGGGRRSGNGARPAE